MQLTPLRQWKCDTCGKIIDGPEQGYLEWLSDDERKAYDFRIVHHAMFAPDNRNENGRYGEGCYQHGGKSRRHDLPLETYTGENGIASLLRFIDVGYVGGDEDRGPWFKSASEFTEIMRRLTIPHYEEARLYWTQAISGGEFDGANEVSPYTQGTLKGIIDNYADIEE